MKDTFTAFIGKLARKIVAGGVGYFGVNEVVNGEVESAVVTLMVALGLMIYDWFKAAWEARAKKVVK